MTPKERHMDNMCLSGQCLWKGPLLRWLRVCRGRRELVGESRHWVGHLNLATTSKLSQKEEFGQKRGLKWITIEETFQSYIVEIRRQREEIVYREVPCLKWWVWKKETRKKKGRTISSPSIKYSSLPTIFRLSFCRLLRGKVGWKRAKLTNEAKKK